MQDYRKSAHAATSQATPLSAGGTVNPNGGAIALGHPLGMSGARIALSAVEEFHRSNGRHALVFMCIGVGQGLAVLLERV